MHVNFNGNFTQEIECTSDNFSQYHGQRHLMLMKTMNKEIECTSDSFTKGHLGQHLELTLMVINQMGSQLEVKFSNHLPSNRLIHIIYSKRNLEIYQNFGNARNSRI